MAEIAPAGGGPNRLFIVIAVGLVGLLLLGLIAVGGILVIPRIFQTSAPAPTIRVAVTTPTRVTPTTAPTSTDTPAPTSTSVIVPLVLGSPAAGETVTATATITGTPGAGGTLPQSGLGEDLLLLAGGVVLVFIIVAARRARATGTA
jgi:hypothetical protein